jgi:hypothetical protein
MDLPPPNIPRVMQDGHLEIANGHKVPVLVQAGSQRLIVLNSIALARMYIGQSAMLHLEDGAAQAVTLEEIDKLALIARYADAVSGKHS